MKKTQAILSVLAVLSLGGLVAVFVLFGQNAGAETGTAAPTPHTTLKDYQDQYGNSSGTAELLGQKVMTLSQPEQSEIYTEHFQNSVRGQLDDLIAKHRYTEDAPLVVWNPFGTNEQSLYVYFETETPYQVSYTVHLPEQPEIGEFGGNVVSRTVTVTDAQGKTQEVGTSLLHEFQITGLIPEEDNLITLRLTDQNGMTIVRRFHAQEIPKTAATYQLMVRRAQKQVTDETDGTTRMVPMSSDDPAEGLFVVFAGENEVAPYLRLYDKGGVQRAEIPLEAYGARRVLLQDGILIYRVSDTKFAGVNCLGQAVELYETGTASIGADYVLDDKGNLLFLGSDTTQNSVEDCIFRVDRATGEVTKLVDFGTLLPEYKESKKAGETALDWLGLNSMEWLGDNMVMLSAKAAGTVIKLRRLYNSPRIVYLIGDPKAWENTSYTGLFLRTEGGEFTMYPGEEFTDFQLFDRVLFLGTLPYDKVREARSYLYLLDNNETMEYEKKQPHYSRYFCYVIDEEEHSVRLVTERQLPEAVSEGSVSWYDGHLVMTGGTTGEFYEYDGELQLIDTFTYQAPQIEKTVEEKDAEEDHPLPDATVWYTRVQKHRFDGYYFEDTPVLYLPENDERVHE